MSNLNIVLAIVLGFGTLANVAVIGKKRQPITPTVAIIALLLNGLIIYGLLH